MRFAGMPTLAGVLIRPAGRRHILNNATLVSWDRVLLTGWGGRVLPRPSPIGSDGELDATFGRRLSFRFPFDSRVHFVARKAQRRWYWTAIENRPFAVVGPTTTVIPWLFGLGFVAAGLANSIVTAWLVFQAIRSPKFEAAPVQLYIGVGLVLLMFVVLSGVLFWLGAYFLRCTIRSPRVKSLDEIGLLVQRGSGPEYKLAWRDLRFGPFPVARFAGGDEVLLFSGSSLSLPVIHAARWKYLTRSNGDATRNRRRWYWAVGFGAVVLAVTVRWILHGLESDHRREVNLAGSLAAIFLLVAAGFYFNSRLRRLPVSRYGYLRKNRFSKWVEGIYVPN